MLCHPSANLINTVSRWITGSRVASKSKKNYKYTEEKYLVARRTRTVEDAVWNPLQV